MLNIIKYIFSLLLSICLTFSVFAQSPESPRIVEGLELPQEQSVNGDEGFVTLQAKTDGEVKWLVVADAKIKYITISDKKTIVISVPPVGGVITVFAIASINGKMTDFARTVINVSSSQTSQNLQQQSQSQENKSLHVTFFVELKNADPTIAAMLNNRTFAEEINKRGHWFRVYDITDNVVSKKKLTKYIESVKSKSVLIIMDNSGRVLAAQEIPKTEKDILDLINLLTKE